MRRLMTYILISVCLFVFLPYYDAPAGKRGIGIAPRPISPLGTEVKGNQWLFVIGIDTYLYWPRLTTAVNDAKAVRDILLSRYYFDKDHLIELYDEKATRKNILEKLIFLAKNVREEDSLVIFYAGHGNLNPITKEGSWIPVESGTDDVSAWISNHDIKNYLKVDAIKAKHVLLISDSCFSGDFFRGHRGKLPEVTDKVIKRAYQLASRQAITSGGLEPVSDEGFGEHSVFTYFLLQALKQSQKPYLVPSDFFAQIKAGVAQNAEQFPRLGWLKDTGGQQGGELVLFLKQDARLQHISSEVEARQMELERLKQMEKENEEARKREAEEIARRERELAELDSKIEAMRKRLGTPAVRADDSLDAMLAMVRQKEEQERRLEELRRQREEEERKRKAEIERLKRERAQKIIAILRPEVEKYKEIVSSKYGKSMKHAAWQSLIAKCPPGWADGVEEGDTNTIMLSPYTRIMLAEQKRREELKRIAEQQKEREKLFSFVSKEKRQYVELAIERCPKNKVMIISHSGKLSQPFPTINSAIKAAKNGDILFVGSGTFYEEINLYNRRNLMFLSTGANIVTKYPDKTIFNIEKCQDIWIYGFHLVHKTAKYCGAVCFRLDSSYFIKIHNCDIEGSGLVGIFLYYSSKIDIVSNKIHNCQEGVVSNGSTKIILKNNHLYDNANTSVKLFNNNAIMNDWKNENWYGMPKEAEEGVMNVHSRKSISHMQEIDIVIDQQAHHIGDNSDSGWSKYGLYYAEGLRYKRSFEIDSDPEKFRMAHLSLAVADVNDDKPHLYQQLPCGKYN